MQSYTTCLISFVEIHLLNRYFCINSHSLGCRFFSGRGSSDLMKDRKFIRDFIRMVHPDLSQNLPAYPSEINSRSLAELNAFLDNLKSSNIHTGCQSSILLFFRQMVTRKGIIVPGRVVPVNVALPCVEPELPFEERMFLFSRIAKDLAEIVSSRAIIFTSDASKHIPSLVDAKNATKDQMTSLFNKTISEAQLKTSLYQPSDPKLLHRQAAKRILSARYKLMFEKEAFYIGRFNSQKKKRYLSKVDKKVLNRLNQKLGSDEQEEAKISAASKELKENILESRCRGIGLHPLQLFVDEEVDNDVDKEEGLNNLLGDNCVTESDSWLLNNLWMATRMEDVTVPVVMVARDSKFSVDEQTGALRIPLDMKVWDLADFMEMDLDHARRVRKEILSDLKGNNDSSLFNNNAT